MIAVGRKADAEKVINSIIEALEECINYHKAKETAQSKNGKKLRDEHSALVAFLKFIAIANAKWSINAIWLNNNQSTVDSLLANI